MENIQIWCLEAWQQIVTILNHQIFSMCAWWFIGSFLILNVFCRIVIHAQSSNGEPNDRKVYFWGMTALGIQALIFITLPILYRADILAFSLLLFSPFVFVILVDIYWLLVLKAKYENNPDSIKAAHK